MALLIGSLYDSIDKIVGIVPSCFVFSGLGDMRNEASSWMHKGKELTYISLMTPLKKFYLPSLPSGFHIIVSRMLKKPTSYRKLYETSVQFSKKQEAARIKTENFLGELFLIAGDADMVWPSAEMATRIAKKRLPLETELLIFKNTGHIIGGPYQSKKQISGGDKQPDKANFFIMMNKIEQFICS